MSRNRWMKPTQLIAGLLVGLLFAVSAIPLGAQPVPETRGRGFGVAYNAAHEITLNGSIQMIVTKHVLGSPVGMHLLVAGPQGVVDAHIGPFLPKATREALQKGMPVRIVGAMATERGKQYLLARELTVASHTVRVRNEHGALVRVHATRAHYANTKHGARNSATKVAVNGGAR